MNRHAEHTTESKNKVVASGFSAKKGGSKSAFQFSDNRPEAVAQRKLQEMADNSPQARTAAQLQALTDSYIAATTQRKDSREAKTLLQGKLEPNQK